MEEEKDKDYRKEIRKLRNKKYTPEDILLKEDKLEVWLRKKRAKEEALAVYKKEGLDGEAEQTLAELVYIQACIDSVTLTLEEMESFEETSMATWEHLQGWENNRLTWPTVKAREMIVEIKDYLLSRIKELPQEMGRYLFPKLSDLYDEILSFTQEKPIGRYNDNSDL